MVGAIATNFHEGSRSEYLAQYIFASFGTAVPVPHQEDSGIDLYCTLTERVGSRAWTRAYFSVQVKSKMEPWRFDCKDSVKWLVEHPFPLFLCVVDKSSARLRLYHTFPRFYAWSLPPLPDKLELTPTTDSEGKCIQWEGSTTFSLSAPILDASLQDLLDAQFHQRAREVLNFWIGVELKNLARIKAGVYLFEMPYEYKTNAVKFDTRGKQGITKVPNLESVMDHVKESVAYLSSQLHRRGDLAGAARCALLLRHFFKENIRDGTHDSLLHDALNEVVGGKQDYLFSGVDSLNVLIDQNLTQAPTNETEDTE